MAYESEFRLRNFNSSTLKIDQIFSGRSSSGNLTYPGDTAIKQDDTICIQIHKVKLKCKEINKYVGKVIYTIAIYYPQVFATGYITVDPEITIYDDDDE
jgi:hypothetical protein